MPTAVNRSIRSVDLGLGADQRRRVDERVGDRLERLVALAVEEQRLDVAAPPPRSRSGRRGRRRSSSRGCPSRRGRGAGRSGRRSRATSRSPSIATWIEGLISRSERCRPPFSKPAARCSPQVSSKASGLKKIGIQPSQTSAAISTDLRPIAPTKTGISLRSGWKLSFRALPWPVPPGHRQLVVLALVLERALAGDDLADDLDVLAGAAPRLRVGHAVPALGDLRARRAEAEHETAAGEHVDRRAGHRGGGGRARRHLHDRRAELDRLGLRGEPGEDGDDVGAVALGDPDRLEPVRLGRADEIDRLLALAGRFPSNPG